jgi:hypothetical protein
VWLVALAAQEAAALHWRQALVVQEHPAKEILVVRAMRAQGNMAAAAAVALVR